MVRPRAFAVLRLSPSSYLLGACTGRSAGFSPLYGAVEVKRLISRIFHFLYFLHTSFFVRLGIPFLRPDPHVLEAVALAWRHAQSFAGRALTAPSTAARWSWSG